MMRTYFIPEYIQNIYDQPSCVCVGGGGGTVLLYVHIDKAKFAFSLCKVRMYWTFFFF